MALVSSPALVAHVICSHSGWQRTQGYLKDCITYTRWHGEFARLRAINHLLRLHPDDGSIGGARRFGCDLDELRSKLKPGSEQAFRDQVKANLLDADLHSSLRWLHRHGVRIHFAVQRPGQTVVSPGGTGHIHAVVAIGRLFQLAHNAPFRLEYLRSALSLYPSVVAEADGNGTQNTATVVPILRLHKHLQSRGLDGLGDDVALKLEQHEQLLEQCRPFLLDGDLRELTLYDAPLACWGNGNEVAHNVDLHVVENRLCLRCFANCWLPKEAV